TRGLHDGRSSNDVFNEMNAATLRARMHLALGEHEAALRTLQGHHRKDSTRGMEAEFLAWWSIAYACNGEFCDAQTLLDRASAMSERVEVKGVLAWTDALIALARSRTKGKRIAQRSFRIAIETGSVDAFVNAYRASPQLLFALVDNEDNRSPLQRILEQARDYSLAKCAGLAMAQAVPQAGKGAPSVREREVLELVSQGLSNKESGDTLFLAQSTAKSHGLRICRKLGVRTRTEAALRAAELADSD